MTPADRLIRRRASTSYWPHRTVSGRGSPAARKMSITENVLAGDLPRLVVFVGRDLTSQTGCTMRSLRTARRLWASRQGVAEPPRVTLGEWLMAAAMLDARRTE